MTKTEDKKMLSTKNLVDLGLVTSLLLLATLSARVILYSVVTARAQVTQEKLAQLEKNLSLAMKYIRCKERTPGTDCGELLSSDCPTRWKEHNGTCYFFSQGTNTWERSRSACKRSQAHLVIISDLMEQLFISKTTKTDIYWIGLTDKDQEGVWKWVNNVTLQSESFWDCNQPNDSGKAQDCATMRPPGSCGALGLWNDDSCAKKHKFICEKEAEDTKVDLTP
ncbi:C-type lectin domain family 4 member E-like [Pleurodeles waltl]